MRTLGVASVLAGTPVIVLAFLAAFQWAEFWPCLGGMMLCTLAAGAFALVWGRDLDLLMEQVRRVTSDDPRPESANTIGEAESAAITDAWDRHVTPPWNTALGGSLFIQGNGIKSDWTHGSIAMEDAAVRELYKWTADGVVVVIHP